MKVKKILKPYRNLKQSKPLTGLLRNKNYNGLEYSKHFIQSPDTNGNQELSLSSRVELQSH